VRRRRNHQEEEGSGEFVDWEECSEMYRDVVTLGFMTQKPTREVR
jgi:hypothetical protein